MMTVKLNDQEIQCEIDRILNFIQVQTAPNHQVVIGVSGGIDSEVTVRLCSRALGNKKLKCFTVVQEFMEDRHLSNARTLCKELEIPLMEFSLQNIPELFLQTLSEAEPQRFQLNESLDLIRLRLSLRTVIFSMYNEHGYLVVSPSNRTEVETGLYMSFGDALGHIKPIAHLYKTQLQQIAKKIGTQINVLEQIPSSGLEKGANDLEDIAYWLQYGSPFIGNPSLDKEFEENARRIFEQLTFEKLDMVLFGLSTNMDHSVISKESGLSENIVSRIDKLKKAAKVFKGRSLGVSLL